MSDYPDIPSTPGGRSHRSRPSLVTNASGLAESTMSFSSMTTAEGLSRLSHFPLPPIGVPLSPFEAQLGFRSSLRSSTTMTPPDTPKAPPIVTADPILPHSGSSIISPSGSAGTNSLPLSPPISPVFRARRHLPTPPPSVGSSSIRPPNASSVASPASSHISPHDWHDGSSTLAMDIYEDRLLPTNFITSLLSTVTQEEEDSNPPDHPPPRYKRDPYEPSVVSGIANTVSSYPLTAPSLQTPPYTPRHDYPPQHLRNPSTSDESSARSPTILSGPLYPPLIPTIPTADGRVTPESSRTYGSEVTEASRAAFRTATYTTGVSGDVPVVGVAHATTQSIAPSLGSMNSTTPLMHSAMSRGDVIHEDTIGELADSAGPSTPTTARRDSQRFRENRSVHSTKTSKSYVPSMITRFSAGERRSFKQAMTWFRKKPLPPVPRLPDFSVHQEIEHRRAEATLPLPDLVHRAQTLSKMLDKGDPPHHSPIEGRNKFEELYLPPSSSSAAPLYNNPSASNPGLIRARKGRSQDYSGAAYPEGGSGPRRFAMTKRRKMCCGVGVVVLVVVVVIAIAVGVTVGKKRSSGPKCAGNFAGSLCNLDGCNQLAQNLVNLIPTLNSQFNMTFTSASLQSAVTSAQGSPGKDCKGQASIVDVGTGLDASQFPIRTQWAQAALLWNLVQTQNVSDTTRLQKLVMAAAWSSLGPDGPTTQRQADFTFLSSGYSYNFAAQTATPPPQTFVNIGQPTTEQIGRVNTVANGALDRIYTSAVGNIILPKEDSFSSLLDGDTAAKGHRSQHLQIPRCCFTNPSTIDAMANPSNQKVSSLLTNSSTTPFPPPLACYPGLGVTQLQSVNAFETGAFGLSEAQLETKFDTDNCYPNRPIYGVLDLLRLRLPFVDTRTGLAKQAAVLTRKVLPRTVVYSGEVLSALPGNNNPVSVTNSTIDPRQFGTLSASTFNFNHVLLKYLSSMDVTVAISLVSFILSLQSVPTPVPPVSTTSFFQSIPSLPALEVAVFGTVLPTDVSATYSSFSRPDGTTLFMGTDESVAVRDWSLVAVPSGSVVWAELATSPEVVRDTSFTDVAFNSVFTQTFNFFHFPSGATVNVGNVTGAFHNVQKFSP
ncbi:hypothetical protein NLI96_g1350 [Meripilus lineatus]|uniref:Uncharacterized protein n=1 Tax=Meripilus lineatus TaxID=2056292 RepID=A0AAD5YHK3_9APHY|nr:hypothetical protein NLI96_g1350 [Physisporinus lineatus]